MIGLEIIKSLSCFLDIRRSALPRKDILEAGNGLGNSQDEFGMFDFDYEDPALDALLGLEGNKLEKDEVRVKDKAFAEV